MMICSDVRPLLELLADEALDTKDSALIVDHLKSCPECQSQWSQLEELKERFRRASKATPVPEDLLHRIGQALDGEETGVTRLPRAALALTGVAAALIITGFFAVTSWYERPAVDRRQTAFASASALVDAVASNRGEPLVERAALPSQLGYNLVYLRLPDWKLEHSAVHRADSLIPIARFDFVKPDADAARGERLVCYQAPAGTIQAAGAQPKLIGGKQVLLGSRANLQYALWSQYGHDYLFVSPLSSQSLEQLIERV
jgi:hypothetical protein